MQVDQSLFGKPYRTDGPMVRYCVYHEDGDKVSLPNPDPKERYFSGACFSELSRQIDGSDNRIWYKPKIHSSVRGQVTEWLNMSISSGLLPPYIHSQARRFVLKFDHPTSLLYIYLCQIRHLEEEPGFVRAVLHLINQGVHPCAAIVFASKTTINNSNHNFVEYGRDYYNPHAMNVQKIQIPIRSIVALRRYLSNPAKYDKRKIRPTSNYYAGFKATETISAICPHVEQLVFLEDTMNEFVLKAINSDTDEESTKYISEFKKDKK